MQFLNHNSLSVQQGFVEPSMADVPLGTTVQFERLGYYAVNEAEGNRVSAFHRVVDLKDTWGKKT